MSDIDSYVGMTLENRDARVSNFEVKMIKTGSDFFVKGLQEFSNTTENDMKQYEEQKIIIFIDIDQDVYQKWTALLINNDDHRQKLVSEIDEDDMDDIIFNSGGVLYYIYGLLINQLTKLKQKEKKDGIAEFLSKNR